MNLSNMTDRRLLTLSQDDYEFIWTAVEAGWTTPRIMREVAANPSAVFIAARAARREQRETIKSCEHCRRSIAVQRVTT